MRRILCPKLPKPDQPVALSKEEAKHLTRVLRMGTGDRIEAMDGDGHSVVAKLKIEGTWVWLHYEAPIQDTTARARDSQLPLVLSLCVLKADSMQWVIEKAVELGVEILRPVISERCVPQVEQKGVERFVDRWERIAEQALKQCGRLNRMTIEPPVSLDQLALRENNAASLTRIWCDETSSIEPAPSIEEVLDHLHGSSNVEILIGPEGGWSENDRRSLLESKKPAWQRVSLGPWVLRAETAALVAAALAASQLRRRN